MNHPRGIASCLSLLLVWMMSAGAAASARAPAFQTNDALIARLREALATYQTYDRYAISEVGQGYSEQTIVLPNGETGVFATSQAVQMNFQVTGRPSNPLDQNANGRMEMTVSVQPGNNPRAATVSFEADVRFVDGAVYIHAEQQSGPSFDLPTDWVRLSSLDDYLASPFATLGFGFEAFFDEGDLTTAFVADAELTDRAITSIALEQTQMESGETVDLLVVELDPLVLIDYDASLLFGNVSAVTSDTLLDAVESFEFLARFAIDSTDRLIGFETAVQYELNDLDYRDFSGDSSYPPNTRLSIAAQAQRQTLIGLINDPSIQPVAAP